MFYYLLYNSSFLNNLGQEKNIKLLIYGTILYIVIHGFIFMNASLEKIQNYFWLLFALDLATIYFIMKNNINGSLNFSAKFFKGGDKIENKKEKNEKEKNEKENSIEPLKEIMEENKPIINIEENLNILNTMNDKLSQLKISETSNEKKVTFDIKDKKTKNSDDLQNIKMEIKDTLLSNNKSKRDEIEKINNLRKSITSESDTDFGSDIDLDAFEKTLD